MRTLEWIIADNARICAEHNLRIEHPIADVTPNEAKAIYDKYGGCVAKFTCDLRFVADRNGWEFVSYPPAIPKFLLTSDHHNECQLCRQALLVYRRMLL